VEKRSTGKLWRTNTHRRLFVVDPAWLCEARKNFMRRNGRIEKIPTAKSASRG